MTGAGFLRYPEGAVAVVTGAANGIGRQVAEDLARLGVAVSAWDLSPEGLAQLEAESRSWTGRVLALEVDVTDGAAVRDAFARTAAELGDVGFLVNNAAPPSAADMPFMEGLLGSLGSVHLVTEAWLETPGSHGGHLVNMSSVAGSLIGIGSSPSYPAAKAGIVGLTRYLALHRPNGIRANAVAPGLVETPRTRELMESEKGRAIIARNPFGRAATAADVSAVVVFLLAPVSEYTNGVLVPVDGGALLVQ